MIVEGKSSDNMLAMFKYLWVLISPFLSNHVTNAVPAGENKWLKKGK